MAKSSKLRIECVPASRLTTETIEAVWQCYARSGRRSLENLSDALGLADEVYVCREWPTNSVRGFKANKLLSFVWEGCPITVVYTLFAGLDYEWRGSNVLQRIFLRRFLALKARHPLRPTYWVFTASTYLSYLVLPRNFVTFWPSRHRSTPARARALMDAVMRRTGTAGWDPERGVIARFGGVNYREGLVGDVSAAEVDPDIQFYAARNPGQARGDTLVCLSQFDIRNVARMLVKACARFFRPRRSDARPGDSLRAKRSRGPSKCDDAAEPRMT